MTQKLEKINIISLIPSGSSFEAMFNPTEYRLQKSNQFSAQKVPGLSSPRIQWASGGAQTLTMKLFFDTYDQPNQGNIKNTDVRKYVKNVTDLLQLAPGRRGPPICQIIWGSLLLNVVLEQATVNYTLFLPDGIPVRATVDVTFKEYILNKAEVDEILLSSGLSKQHVVKARDTLISIANDEYADSTKWRLIAEANNLDDPLAVQPGQTLIIPPKK